jgi:hypothetical protein
MVFLVPAVLLVSAVITTVVVIVIIIINVVGCVYPCFCSLSQRARGRLVAQDFERAVGAAGGEKTKT